MNIKIFLFTWILCNILKDKVKIVSKNLDLYQLLTLVGLAYWITEDGSKSAYDQTTLLDLFQNKKLNLFKLYCIKIFNY